MTNPDIEAEYVRLAAMLSIGQERALKTLRAADDPEEALVKLRKRHKRLTSGIGLRVRKREADRLAAEARKRHDQRQRTFAQEREDARKDMTLGQRLDTLLADFSLLSRIKAAGIQPSIGHSKPETRAPKAEESEGAIYERRIALLIESAERALDQEKGFLLDGAALDSPKAKDEQIVSKWEGVQPEEIAFLAPDLGSAAYIAKVREERGLRARDGRPKPDEESR